MTNRKFLSFLLAIFMVLSTVIPLFAENDSVTVLPPRMAEEEEPQNIVIIEDDKDNIPIFDKSEEGGKEIEETPEESEIEKDNSPVILENREEGDNNNIVILPPIRNEEELEDEETKETSTKTDEPEKPKEEKENKKEVKVQILSKRDAKKPASNGEVNLVLLNDNPADINEDVYDEKIRWKESDFKIEDDKIISLSDEGLLKVARNKKLVIPEMENITIIEKEAFKGLSLRSVEIPKNIKEIKDEAFKDNQLKLVKILGKGKEISESAFNKELVEMYGKCEKEEFLYECEDELEIGEKIVGDALGAVAPDDVSLYTFSGTIITGLSEQGKTYYSTNHDMVLPGETPDGYAVDKIGKEAFYNNGEGYGIRSVDFSKCTALTDIENYAFYNNSIQNVYLMNNPSLKRIGISAFRKNEIINIDLTKNFNLQSIELGAFGDNKITDLDLSGCNNLRDLASFSFKNNNIANLDLSNNTNLRSIGNQTFANNKLTMVNIPLNLSVLRRDAFKENPGSNKERQVYLYTPDKTNPNNLKDTDYHLINSDINPDYTFLYTFNGTEITGLSEKGIKYFENYHDMFLPDKNPEGQLITSIADGAFSKINLTSVNFKDMSYLENIGKEAFLGNILQDVDLSYCKNLKNIGEAAFSENHITNINLSNLEKLQSIGAASFVSNKITNVDLSNLISLTEIGQLAFAGNQINNVNFSGCINLYEIKDSSFRRNQITSLNFTNCEKLEKINDASFAENKLTTINIPVSLKYISNTSFVENPGNNNKKQVYLYTSTFTNPNNLQDTDYHLINPITGPDDLSFYTFNGTTITGLTEEGKKYYRVRQDMVLPSKNPQGEPITAIADNAFSPEEYDETFPKFKSIDFSNSSSLVTIGKSAFDNHVFDKIDLSPCTNLQEIDNGAFGLPENMDSPDDKQIEVSFKGLKNLKRIGRGAFAGPDIGDRYRNFDFSGCTGLEIIDDWAFAANSFRNLDLSDCSNLKSIGKFAFSTCGLMSVNLSNCTSLTKIDKLAFSSNGPLQNLDMSNCSSLEIIEESAFDNSALKNVDLSTCTNLKTIGANAFGYSKITEGKIPLSLITLSDNAFQGNPGNNDKKQVYLYTPNKTNPNNLQDTEYHLINPITGSDDVSLYTFSGTTITGLSERGKKYFAENHDMVLPGKNPQGQAITEIKDRAFCNDWKGYGLTSVDFSACKELGDIGRFAFANNQITNVNLSECKELFSISHSAFASNQITNVNLSNCEALEIIESEAFMDNQITTVDLSNCTSLGSIRGYAFDNNKLTNLDLSGCINLTSLGSYVFAQNQLKTADIPMSLKYLGGTTFKDNIGSNDKKQVYLYTIPYRMNPNNLQDSEYHLINFPITGPDDVTLYTFEGTTITGLTERGKKYFKENPNLVLPEKNPEGESIIMIGPNAFSPEEYDENYPVFESVDFSNCSSLLAIGNGAFAGHYFDKLDLSPCTSLIAIGDSAFAFNEGSHGPEDKDIEVSFRGLKNLKIIGQSAFAGPDIGNRVGKIDFSGCTGLETIGEGAFFWSRIDNLDLSSCTNLKTIKKMAFMSTDLKTLNLSGCKNLTTIEEAAFHGNELNSIDFSGCSNLQTIGSYAFAFSSLKTLDLSKCTSLKVIEKGAFYNGKINIAYIPLSLSTLADDAFQDNPGNNDKKQVYLYTPDYTNPNNLKDTDYHLINPITGSDDVSLYTFDGTTITGLSERGKEYFKENHEMVLPGKTPDGQDVTAIGRYAFDKNNSGYGITSVDFKNLTKLKNIGPHAFQYNPITSIDFSHCTELENIDEFAFFKNQISEINFSNCKNLSTIGNSSFSINKIKNLNMSDCINLKEIDEYAFSLNEIKNLDLSACKNLNTIKRQAFSSNELNIAKIPFNLQNVDTLAFEGNPGKNKERQVFLYTPIRNNPQNLPATDYHLVDPITFTIKKVDAKGNSMRGVEFAFYKVDRPTPPAPPQNETNKTDETELEISSENVPSAVGGPTISMPDIDLNLNPDGPIPEFFPDPETIVGVKPIFITVTTNFFGEAEVTLPYSPYFLAENKTITGYSINNTVTPIDATTEGKIITYTDYEVSIEIPETGTLGTLPYILLALILVGGAYLILRKKKKKNSVDK